MADTKPTEGVAVASADTVLKKWILPSANDFIKDSSKHYQRPKDNPGRQPHGDPSIGLREAPTPPHFPLNSELI